VPGAGERVKAVKPPNRSVWMLPDGGIFSARRPSLLSLRAKYLNQMHEDVLLQNRSIRT
jgi:hypothetical protein